MLNPHPEPAMASEKPKYVWIHFAEVGVGAVVGGLI